MGGVGVCGAGYGAGAGVGAALGRVVGVRLYGGSGRADCAGAGEVGNVPGGIGIFLHVEGQPRALQKNSFDFVAAYVIPEDVWYILPEKVVRGMWSIGLNPGLEGAKYNGYKEAWHLLTGETPGFVERIEACAEEGGLIVNP